MKNTLKYLSCAGLLVLASSAHAVSLLTIAGEYQPPGISGTFENDTAFSWISHRFSSSHEPFSWLIGGGTENGIIFNEAQSYGELTGELIMFNQPTAFYSVGSGISISQNNTINMSNLRMSQSGEIINIGSGSGYSTLVPYVDDLLLLGLGENGWSIDTNNVYHLFYNTSGTCLECEMTIHLTGTTTVPVPAPVWLLSSGLIGLIGAARRKEA